MERVKAKHTIDISMRLLVDEDEHVLVDGWEVAARRPHGNGVVKATTPETPKAREFVVWSDPHFTILGVRTAESDKVHVHYPGYTYIRVREVLPEDDK